MERITSSNNNTIKDIKKLDRRKNRWENKEFIIEGFTIIKEAIDNNIDLKCVLYSEDIKEYKELKQILNRLDDNTRIIEIPYNLFKEISDTETPQGILGLVGFKKNRIEDIIEGERPLILFLDGLQDPGNLGTIIRTGDAFNIDGIILGEGTVDPYNSKVVRATMGSIFRVPIYLCDDSINCIEMIKAKDIDIYSTDLNGESIYEEDFSKGSLFIIGNESVGVSNKLLELSNRRIKIPMPGKAESLNAGVAASILMYEGMKFRL